MTDADQLAVYLDASALVKLVLEEPESAALADHVGGRMLMSSDLALTEVPRAARALAVRALPPEAMPEIMARLDEVFDGTGLVTLDTRLLTTAALLDPPVLRSVDALHVATARALGFEEFVTYDARQARGAAAAGLRPVSPGAVPSAMI